MHDIIDEEFWSDYDSPISGSEESNDLWELEYELQKLANPTTANPITANPTTSNNQKVADVNVINIWRLRVGDILENKDTKVKVKITGMSDDRGYITTVSYETYNGTWKTIPQTHSINKIIDEWQKIKEAPAPRCECGAIHTSNTKFHSKWCPDYKK